LPTKAGSFSQFKINWLAFRDLKFLAQTVPKVSPESQRLGLGVPNVWNHLQAAGATLAASRAIIRHRHTIDADVPAGLNQSDDCEGGAFMSQTIELPDESVPLLKRQAAAHGLTIDAWVAGARARKGAYG
jgi:hypothetical protein